MSLLSFGPFTLDPHARILSREGRVVELQPLAFDLLAHGARNPGTLLDRQILRQTLWPDVVVTDHSLTQLVHRIRKGLGEHKGLWVTVPRKGYRFDGQVQAHRAKDLQQPSQARPPRDRFVGREGELKQLADYLLADLPRPVLIHGPGGAGKTRLALQFISNNRERWPAVIPITLAADRDRADVVVRVASTLGIQLPAGTGSDHESRIARSLAHRTPGVILLDNLEQLSEPARALLAEWMKAAPHQSWLATSRDLVDLPDVACLPLPPLPSAPAIALFVARGTAAGAPAPSPGDPDLDAIMSVLEGSPLAIELAAARLPLLGLASMRTRLSDVLTVLSGRRTGAPRHRSMATATAWSWELLQEDERLVLMAGALFPESFTLDAVESTVEAARPGTNTLAIMHRLLDLSLLQPASARVAGHQGRLSYARTVRAFALEQLRGSPHENALKAGFVLTMRAYMNRAERLLEAWDMELARELVQELPALEVALSPDACERGVRITLGRLCDLVYALHRSSRILDSLGDPTPDDGLDYWLLFFSVLESTRIREALETEPYAPVLARGGAEAARLYKKVGAAASELGDMARAQDALERARALLCDDDDELRADVAFALAVFHLRTGDIDRAEIEVDSALEAARRTPGNHPSLPGMLDLRGYLYTQRSTFDLAKRYQMEAQELALAMGLERVRARNLCNLGSTLQESGEFEAALSRLNLAIELAARHGDPVLTHAVANRGLTYLHLGDTVRARQDLRSVELATAGPWLHAVATINEAAVDAAEHRWDACRVTAQRALTALRDMSELVVVESAGLLWLTLACARLGDAEAVKTHRARQDAIPRDTIPSYLREAWKQVEAEIEGVDLPVPPGSHALVRLVARIRERAA